MKHHRKRSGVSVIIGTVLLVAITVILVSMLGIFVFNIIKIPSNNNITVYFGMPNNPTTSYPNQLGLWEWVPVVSSSNNLFLGDMGFKIVAQNGTSILSIYPHIEIAVDVFNGSNTYGQYGNATGGYGHPGYFSISWWSPPPGQWHYYTPEGSPTTIFPAGAWLGIHVFLNGTVPPLTILQNYVLVVYAIGSQPVSGSVTLD